jgi:hypothetical protein
MKLPQLTAPERYRGLYVFDFGGWTAVGYTAEEIAILLESEKYRGGRVYKIHRAFPDGRFELKGVSGERFQFESCVAFNRIDERLAHRDFHALAEAAQRDLPPCRAMLHLAAPADPDAPYSTMLIYPAEYEEEISAWLTRLNYEGGDTAEGGISHVTNYYEEDREILEQRQLWSDPEQQSRSRDEIYATVRQAVQR